MKFPKTAWQKALQRAKVDNFHWHVLRHEYANRLVEAGTSAPEVQKLMGHASIVTTQRYFTARDERLRAAVQAAVVGSESEKSNDRKSLN